MASTTSNDPQQPESPLIGPEAASTILRQESGTQPSIRLESPRPGPLKAGCGTVICCLPDRILTLDVDATGEAVRIEIVHDQNLDGENDEAFAVGLEECIRSLPKKRRAAHLMALEPLSCQKVLHLPPMKGRRLRNLAHFSLSGGVPMESRLRIQGDSYEGRDKGIAVRAAGIPESLLNDIRKIALVSNCKLQRICTRPVGGPALVDLFGQEGAAQGRYMLIELTSEHLRLSLVADGTVRFSRSVQVPRGEATRNLASHIVTEVQRTNIFIGGRFREKPGDHLVLLTDSLADSEELSERLRDQLRAPLFTVQPRIRIQGEAPTGIPNLLVDAGALVLRKDPTPLGAFNMRPASLRWLALAAVAVSIVTCVLMGAPLWERGQAAQLTAAQDRELLTTLEEEAARLPDRRSELAQAEGQRDRMTAQLGDLLPLLPPRVSSSRLIEDVLSRLPPEIIVDRVNIKRSGGDSGETPENPSRRRIVEISGHSVASLKLAAGRTPSILKSLRASPFVRGGRDLSGKFDPFAVRKSGKVPLYPVKFRLLVEDPR